MRIPAFAIAAAFSGGILLGPGWQLSPRVLEIPFLCISSLLIAAFIFAWPKKVWTAAIFSLVGWVWLGNKLRLPRMLATVLLLAALFAYIAVVEQRAPVLRAGLMTGIVVLAGFSYRRLEILNSAAVPCWWRSRRKSLTRVFSCRFWRSGASGYADAPNHHEEQEQE